MKAVSAGEAKRHFGQLIDEARAEPVVVEKHGRPVVVVLAVEEYQRLTGRTVEPSSKARSSSEAVAHRNNEDKR